MGDEIRNVESERDLLRKVASHTILEIRRIASQSDSVPNAMGVIFDLADAIHDINDNLLTAEDIDYQVNIMLKGFDKLYADSDYVLSPYRYYLYLKNNANP